VGKTVKFIPFGESIVAKGLMLISAREGSVTAYATDGCLWSIKCLIQEAEDVPNFSCAKHDTIQGRELTLTERFAVATKSSRRNAKQGERAALPNVIELAVEMKVMMTFNINTDLDVANGAQGKIKEIILDGHESNFYATKLWTRS